MENWKPVKGYEGQYLVSDQGRVMNNKGHILTPSITSSGSIQISIGRQHLSVSRLVAFAFLVNAERYKYLEYRDGNKQNCRADNLYWTNATKTGGVSQPILLISETERIKAPSVSAAAKLIDCSDSSLRAVLANTNKVLKVKGFAATLADDVDRQKRILSELHLEDLNIPSESWKKIDGVTGYMVSDKGRIMSFKKKKPSILRTTIQESGYEYVSLSQNGHCLSRRVHRLVANAFLPNPANLPEINHKDGNPLNNNVTNLEWCSQEFNLNDEWNRRKDELSLV